MQDQIKKLYEKQKRGKIKAVLVCVIVYFLMIGIVSIYYGSPFPHKEIVVFIEMTQRGWIYTRGYLLLLCAAVGLIVGVGSIIITIMYRFKILDSILLLKCDTKEYLEMMRFAVSYGKKLNFKGYQKTVFLLAQQKYVLAMIANRQLSEARKYLDDEWRGNRNSRLYKRLRINISLVEWYQNMNSKEFQSTLEREGKIFQKNKLFVAEKFMLEEQYETAAKFLNNYTEKMPYNEVNRNYLLGQCYAKLGEQEKAKGCMKYVEEYGNTMPCKKQAQEWLMFDSLKLLEQKEERL